MKRKDMLAILGVAAATTAFMVGLLGPRRVVATGVVEGIKPIVAQPKLTVDGCVFSLKTDKPAYRAGDEPTLRVEAVNATDKPVETTLWLSMSASRPPSPLARVLMVPRPLWTQKYLVRLGPGEAQTVPLATKTKLPAGENISITMSDKNLSVLARAFSVRNSEVPTPTASQPAPAIQLVQ